MMNSNKVIKSDLFLYFQEFIIFDGFVKLLN